MPSSIKHLGDKGQRYVVKGRLHEEAPLEEFAYSETREAARRWVKSMKTHPSWCDFRIVDRVKRSKKKK